MKRIREEWGKMKSGYAIWPEDRNDDERENMEARTEGGKYRKKDKRQNRRKSRVRTE